MKRFAGSCVSGEMPGAAFAPVPAPAPVTKVGAARRSVHGLRFAAEFGLLPLAVGWFVPPVAWLPALWLVALLAVWRLRRSPAAPPIWPRDSEFDWIDYFNAFIRVLVRFAGAAVLLGVLVAVFLPGQLFDFPRQRTGLWLLVMILYPVASVYPQELLYRRYFFARYAGLFAGDRLLVLASAVAFGAMHLVFRNPWAVALTLAGGWLFADTYRRTGSLRLVCFEHALYGNLVFTVGLGRFVFHGAVAQ